MKQERLFEAIGGLDETLIAETETVEKPRGKRIGWKVALVAAVVAGLAITAVAAPVIRNALLGGKTETDETQWFTPTNPQNGSCYEVREHRITLDVDMDAEAPKTIETFYVPRISEGYKQQYGYFGKNYWTQFGWMAEEGSLSFYQTAGGMVRSEHLRASVFAVPGDTPKTELRTFSDVQGFLIEQKPLEEHGGAWIFYWSDGEYLFRLDMPYGYTDAQIEQTVAGIHVVEDVTPYLISVGE